MKLYLFFFAFLTASLVSPAQKQVLSVGSTSSLTIKSGTVFSADSLVLTPSSDLTLTASDLQVSSMAVNAVPRQGITRVYYLSSPINFSGTIQIYYQTSELNGGSESTLEYADSAAGASWVTQAGSTVNTSLHYVGFTASNESFAGASATGQIVSLALSLISFTGNWTQNGVGLQWVVDQNDEIGKFEVESCPDGVSWQKTGQVAGNNGNGLYTYQFTDANPSSSTMYYRIKMIRASGSAIWSNIIKLHKGNDNNDIILVPTGNGVSAHFPGTQPTGIRLINVSGMILRTDKTSRQEYDLSGLVPGAYFIQYQMNGQWNVRKFIVQ